MEIESQVLEIATIEKIYTIAEIKEKTKEIFEKYAIKKAYIFGSYARSEAKKNSDIDIMIHTPQDFSLISLEELYEDLTLILQKKIDIVTEETYTRDIKYLKKDSSLYQAKKMFFDKVEKERKKIYG